MSWQWESLRTIAIVDFPLPYGTLPVWSTSQPYPTDVYPQYSTYFVDIHVSDLNVYPSGWWFQLSTPLKNDGARQLGLWHSQYIEKKWSKPPAICLSISTMYLQKSHHVWSTSICAQGTLRSDRQGAPVLIWPVQRPTAKSAIVVSSPAGGALQAWDYPMLSNKN